jgi:hypothetical protein
LLVFASGRAYRRVSSMTRSSIGSARRSFLASVDLPTHWVEPEVPRGPSLTGSKQATSPTCQCLDTASDR